MLSLRNRPNCSPSLLQVILFLPTTYFVERSLSPNADLEEYLILFITVLICHFYSPQGLEDCYPIFIFLYFYTAFPPRVVYCMLPGWATADQWYWVSDWEGEWVMESCLSTLALVYSVGSLQLSWAVSQGVVILLLNSSSLDSWVYIRLCKERPLSFTCLPGGAFPGMGSWLQPINPGPIAHSGKPMALAAHWPMSNIKIYHRGSYVGCWG